MHRTTGFSRVPSKDARRPSQMKERCVYLRQTHGTRGFISMSTVSNQCMWCRTSYSPQQAAYHHVLNSVDRGACMADRTPLPHAILQPEDLMCSLCDSQLDYPPAMLDHLAAHFDFAPQLSLPACSAEFGTLLVENWRRRRAEKSGNRGKRGLASFASC